VAALGFWRGVGAVIVVGAVGLLASGDVFFIIIGCCDLAVDVVDVAPPIYTVTLSHNLHKHSPPSPLLLPISFSVVMCCEKNLSPLSCGKTSAFGKGHVHPMDLAMLLMCHNSEWLTKGTIFSHAAGINLR